MLMTAAISLSLFNSVDALSAKPDKCPSVSSIASTTIRVIHTDANKLALAQEKNFYDTNVEWSFLLTEFRAEDENDARAKGNEFLKSLNHLTSLMNTGDSWTCVYYEPTFTVSGTAVTPPMNFDNMPKIFRR